MSAQILSVQVNPAEFMPVKQVQLMQINRNLPPVFIDADNRDAYTSRFFDACIAMLALLSIVAAVVL